jgi:steroid 5-alpha reductase family enzyme
MKHFILFIVCALALSALVMLPFAGGLQGLSSFVSGADALVVVSLWALGFALCAFVFGLVTGDYSWIDRLWSTLPVAFVWYYAYRGGFSFALCAISILVTLWGARLSFNFARKEGYSGVEDYRWSVLRGKINNPFLWQLFNLFFISLYQTGMFVLFTFPVYSMVVYNIENPPALFWVCAALGFACICLEIAADQQQWNFHAAKKAAVEKKDFPARYSGDVANGFLSRGLFSLSRHPNYFGELGFWWSIWFTALACGIGFVNSGFFGPIALTVLFIGSTIFTESISAGKYPEYRAYQARVSMVIPWFPWRSKN